jgi:hypothetical protein
MLAKTKVPVTMRALMQRINRKLKPDDEVLKVARSERVEQELGKYYTLDHRRNVLIHKDVDPEELGRELGVLRDYEKVVED